jgi:hypothetical protein
MITPKARFEALTVYALYRAGFVDAQALIDCAVQLLVDNVDTPAIRIMAGLNANDYPDDIRKAFEELLESIGATNSSQEVLHLMAGFNCCQLMLEHKISPRTGLAEMYSL